MQPMAPAAITTKDKNAMCPGAETAVGSCAATLAAMNVGSHTQYAYSSSMCPR